MHLKALASALQAFGVMHGLPCLMILADRPSGFDVTIFLALDAVKPICTATVHVEDNRLQLFFPDLPEADSIAAVVKKNSVYQRAMGLKRPDICPIWRTGFSPQSFRLSLSWMVT